MVFYHHVIRGLFMKQSTLGRFFQPSQPSQSLLSKAVVFSNQVFSSLNIQKFTRLQQALIMAVYCLDNRNRQSMLDVNFFSGRYSLKQQQAQLFQQTKHALAYLNDLGLGDIRVKSNLPINASAWNEVLRLSFDDLLKLWGSQGIQGLQTAILLDESIPNHSSDGFLVVGENGQQGSFKVERKLNQGSFSEAFLGSYHYQDGKVCKMVMKRPLIEKVHAEIKKRYGHSFESLILMAITSAAREGKAFSRSGLINHFRGKQHGFYKYAIEFGISERWILKTINNVVDQLIEKGEMMAVNNFLCHLPSQDYLHELRMLQICKEQRVQGVVRKKGQCAKQSVVLMKYLPDHIELFDHIVACANENKPINRKVYINMSKALEALHAAGIYHRDIKPENLVVNPNNSNVVIIDLGAACTSDAPEAERKKVVGTMSTISQRLLNGEAANKSTEYESLIRAMLIVYEQNLRTRNNRGSTNPSLETSMAGNDNSTVIEGLRSALAKYASGKTRQLTAPGKIFARSWNQHGVTPSKKRVRSNGRSARSNSQQNSLTAPSSPKRAKRRSPLSPLIINQQKVPIPMARQPVRKIIGCAP